MFNKIKRIIYSPILNREQKKLNKAFKENGYSDELFDKQVKLNKKRCKYNIPDKTKFVYDDFVQ